MAGPLPIPEESPVLQDCPAAFPEGLQMIHPMTADSWKNFIEQIGKGDTQAAVWFTAAPSPNFKLTLLKMFSSYRSSHGYFLLLTSTRER